MSDFVDGKPIAKELIRICNELEDLADTEVAGFYVGTLRQVAYRIDALLERELSDAVTQIEDEDARQEPNEIHDSEKPTLVAAAVGGGAPVDPDDIPF